MGGDFALYILTALALIFVIEGLIYGLFTDSVRRMMAMALTLPPERLRVMGFGMAALGMAFLFVLDKLSQ